MKYHLRIEISLKPGHSDPEGETTAKSLQELGYDVVTTSISKIYKIGLEAKSRKEAYTKAEEMSKKLLANPTKDNYAISIEEDK